MAGEDCLEAIRLLRGRISHVHLKDRVSKSDMSCPAIGAGCIPEAEVIRILRDSGYSGWLTVEHFGARDMLKAANPICQETEAWHPLAFRKHYKP